MKTTNLLLIAAIIGLTAPRPAPAGWTNDPYNGFAKVANTTYNEVYQDVCQLAGNRTCVIWRSEPLSADSSSVYYQVLDQFGNRLLQLNGRPIFEGSWKTSLYVFMRSIIPDGQGGCIVVVRDKRDGTWDVWGQRIDSLGNRLWGPNGVPLILWPGPEAQYVLQKSLTCDSLGNFFLSVGIAMQSYPSQNTMNVQKFLADGTTLWGSSGALVRSNNFPFPDVGADWQRPVPDMEGGILECWVDWRLGSFSPRIYFQHLNSQGQPLLAVDGIPVISSGTPLQTGYLDGGVPDGSGGGIWSCANWIYLWRLDGMGHMRWSWVNSSYHGVLSMIRHPSDGTIWFSSQLNNDQYSLFRFTVNGQPLFGANGVPYGGSLVPVSGGVISSMYNWFNPPWGTYSYRVNNSGTVRWRSDISLNDSVSGFVGSGAEVPNICSDGADGIVIGLQDARYGFQMGNAIDIAAQRVNADGTLGAPPKHQLLPEKTIGSLTPDFISYMLDQAGEVKFELYDILGRRIALIEQGWREAGAYKLKWNDEGWASGVYLLRMEIAGQVKVRKVAVVR